jgi:SOS-response transcriptional repressor LexA
MIQWTENIKLPLYFHKKITFEFSVRNKFMGSGGMLMGSAVIVNFKNKVYEGKVFDGQREEVGRFQF